MTRIRSGSALRDIGVLFGGGTVGGLSDGQLLGRFAARRDVAGEQAFAALVDRHGPMVLRVCRGVLGERADAEDAFQATFLVLARKSGILRVRDTIGPWLHAVALRTARHALADRVRRGRHDRRAAPREATACPPVGIEEDGAVLHQEVDRLPEALRRPIVLCYLEGLTHEQAADRLGWPVGTVRSRLARGRNRLRGCLNGRGITSAVVLPAGPGAVGRGLVDATVRLATASATAAGKGPVAFTLSRGVVRIMYRNSLMKAAAAVAVVGGLAAAAAGIVTRAADPPAAAYPVAPIPVGDGQASEAEKIAKDILHIDIELYSAKDSFALGNIYAAEDIKVHLFGRRGGKLREEIHSGRADVEAYYRGVFEGAGAIRPKNTLEHAELVAPDLLVIQGRFSPNTGVGPWPFVQLRAKQGKDWLLRELWLFPGPDDQP